MSRKLLIALVALVGVLAIGVCFLAAYIFVIQPAKGGEQIPGRVPVRAEAAGFYTLDKFVTNLADTNRTRYIEVSVALGTTTANSGAELERLDPQMRDVILSQIRSMTSEDLSGAEGKDRLAAVIEEGLRKIPAVNARLVKVYVTDMVIQ